MPDVRCEEGATPDHAASPHASASPPRRHVARASIHAAALLVGLSTLAACAPGRGPNRLLVTGARLVGSRGDTSTGPTGMIAAEAAAEVVVTDTTPVGASYRSSAAIGFNEEGVAGAARLSANLGWQLDPALGFAGKPLHTLHVRLGVDGRYETSVREGLSWIELPTIGAGYTFHGQGTASYADTMHLHVGPRAGLALAGAFEDGDREALFRFVPDLGGELLFAGESVWLEAKYHALVAGRRIDVFEANACVAQGIAACVETRLGSFPFPGSVDPRGTVYVGLTIGIGISTGVDR